jgi:hypothetical protein
MKIALLMYRHRHGVDCLLARISDNFPHGLPEITNEFLRDKMGVIEPQLERDDEYTEWYDVIDTDNLPVL